MSRILLLCWRDTGHPQGGGSERYLEEMARHLAAGGHEVYFRTAMYPGARRRETRDGVHFSRGGGRLGVYPRALSAILGARLGIGPLRRMRTPDVVVDTQNGIPFLARLATPAPVVVLSHHCHREQWPVAGPVMSRIGWFIESRLSPRVHRHNQYVTVSLPSARELRGLGVDGGRIAVVRNGADEVPDGVPTGDPTTRESAPTLVTLARLVPHKQIEDAIDVLAGLRRELPAARLDVIGSGWWADELRAHARSRGVEDAVVFHGHVTEERKHELLARAWLHVMPSRKEGWGLAVVEAARHGVPTIGYVDSAGLTDSVVDGVTGLLVGDRRALLDACREVLGDPGLRERLGEAARERADRFSWDASAEAFEEILEHARRGEFTEGVR